MNTTLSDASRKPLFPRGPGLGVKFLLFSLLSLGLIVTDSRSDRLAPVRQWTAWALTPVQWVGGIPQAIGGSAQHFRSRETLIAENAQLRENQLQQEAKLLRLASLESENQRIRELLASAASLQDRVLIAEILSTSQDPYRHQIVLNKGAKDGVYKGQALVDAAGIMGQVVQVNATSCVALLITDPDHGIPVEINRTGLQTIALGRGDGQGLSLPYLPGNADVKVGDQLVSSGLGGRFPAGYPVGEIFELRHPNGESFMEAVAYPKAKLNQGRQALLVWSERPTQTPETVVPVDLHPPQPPKKSGGRRTSAASVPAPPPAAASPAAAPGPPAAETPKPSPAPPATTATKPATAGKPAAPAKPATAPGPAAATATPPAKKPAAPPRPAAQTTSSPAPVVPAVAPPASSPPPAP